VQRVTRATVTVDTEVVGAIGAGVLVLLGVEQRDVEADAERLAGKIARLRIFDDEAGQLNRSLLDAGGAALVVSQFTLLADTSRGNRPSFTAAAPPGVAQPLWLHFAETLGALGVEVALGRFGASMRVDLINDGPVTICL
jgi:D-aminoacyl-tRNA deacylase